MAIFQNQATQEKEVFLKKINKYFLALILGVFSLIPNKANLADNKNQKILEYFQNISFFSSNFYQNSGNSIEEGKFFLNNKDKRLRIQYLKPTNVLIIMAENKAMYFNQDLEEVQYFNPEKSIAGIFFKIFNEPGFFLSSEVFEKEQTLIIEKKIISKNEDVNLEILFEKNPLIIRKITLENLEERIIFSIFNTNFNPIIKKDFFSMANPLLK